MTYLGEVVSSAFSIIFFIAVIAALGYLVGESISRAYRLERQGFCLSR